MINLFKKAICFTDLHYGEKSNEKRHNEDCGKFVDWVIKRAKEEKADHIIFLGDWNHQRNSLRVDTLAFSRSGLKKLNECGIPVIMIVGNHDLYYKDSRDVSSIDVYGFDNITVYDSITKIGNVVFCPWLVGKEKKDIKDVVDGADYVFGHFELPAFLMNAMIEYKGHEGQICYDDFDNVKYWAFSGHFHKRQSKGKVFYMGNCFPHDFNDVWDDERGIMILNWGENPEFEKFPDAPKYRDMNLSELLEDMPQYVDENTFMKVTPDFDLNYEEYAVIMEVVKNNFSPRKFEIRSSNIFSDVDNEVKIDGVKTVDSIVLEGIDTIESNVISKELLKQMYVGLIT